MPNIPPPPDDTLTLYVEIDGDDIHFVDNIFKSYDNLAQVRRDYETLAGRPCFEIHVPPQLLDETRAVLARLGEIVHIGRMTLLTPDGPIVL